MIVSAKKILKLGNEVILEITETITPMNASNGKYCSLIRQYDKFIFGVNSLATI
jgi:hypothetical protein